MKNTLNVVVLVKKIVLLHLKSAHFNVFWVVFVRKDMCVKLIIKVNVFHVLNVPVLRTKFSIHVDQHVLIPVQQDFNPVLNNVYLVVYVKMVLFV